MSSYTATENCVEVAPVLPTPGVAVRDSKRRRGPSIELPGSTWTALIEAVRTAR